jgi:ubiquinone/menaquinone biosynthesis C-methylase UbiE/DNA-binding transcriptional ArsR family regulator
MNAAAPAILGWMTALADVTRARTLRLVEQYELTVADLCAVLQLPQSTVSRHLKLLADEGWVAARPEGTSRLYRMGVDDLEPAARRLWNLIREQTAQTRAAAHDDQRLATILAARQSRSQAFFSSAAGQWDRLRRDMFGDRFDLMALAGLLEDTWVVGDLGCGTGQISETVAPFVQQVIAVDSSRAMLKAARQRLAHVSHVDIRHGDLEALPIDDAVLDAAVSSLVLHHVGDPPAVLRAAARALRPGGRLLIIDMLSHDRREYQQQMGHVWLGFEPAQITDWLQAAGFERSRVQPLPPAPHAKGPALFAATARRLHDEKQPTRRRDKR